jgi:hypothetical protein
MTKERLYEGNQCKETVRNPILVGVPDYHRWCCSTKRSDVAMKVKHHGFQAFA